MIYTIERWLSSLPAAAGGGGGARCRCRSVRRVVLSGETALSSALVTTMMMMATIMVVVRRRRVEESCQWWGNRPWDQVARRLSIKPRVRVRGG